MGATLCHIPPEGQRGASGLLLCLLGSVNSRGINTCSTNLYTSLHINSTVNVIATVCDGVQKPDGEHFPSADLTLTVTKMSGCLAH